MNRPNSIKQGSGGRRSRRGNGKRNPKNSNFDSNGPDVRVRGNAQQVLDRYLTLARDSQTSGDRIASENYFQHAEHYYRILHANDGEERRNDDQRQQPSQPADRPQEPEPHELMDDNNSNQTEDGAQWERTNQPQVAVDTDESAEADSPASGEAIESSGPDTTETPETPDASSSEPAVV